MDFTIDIKKGEKYFVARIPELKITTQGSTEKEAKENLKEALQLHLESMVEYMIEKNVKFNNNKIIPQ